MLRFIMIFVLMLCIPIAAQQESRQIQADTSFTNYSAAVKVYKKFPQAKLAVVPLPEGIRCEENVTFAIYGNRELKLDIYFPEKPDEYYPAVVFVHGGGWRSGSRQQESALARKLAGSGYVVLPADYRLSTEDLYPAAVYDLKAAVRWVRSNSKKYHIDSNKVAILGCSAGGQLASLIGTTAGIEKFEGSGNSNGYSSSVQAIVNIDGLVDFTNIESTKYDNDPDKPSAASQWFGAAYKIKPDLWKEASPIFYVNKNTPPVIFINSALEHYHAGRDDMIAKLKEFNIYYEVHTIPDTPHPFWLFHPWFDSMFEQVRGFLDRKLKRSQ